MGKSRKRLAVLLAATMAISMMTGFTSFAAEEETAPETTEIVVEVETPAPAEIETPAPAEIETPAPVETETPAPAEIETPAPAETETPAPAETETPVPAETETPAPAETETLVPAETETPAPAETETPAPAETETLVPAETETPVPAEGETVVTEEAAVTVTADQAYTAPANDPDTTDETGTTEGTGTPAADDAEEPGGTEEEEIPETVIWIAGNQIEEKDEFVSLGEDKGEYKYYDGTLILKNVVIEIEPEYGGAAIEVYGTLVIDLEGDNYLTTTGDTVLWVDLEDYTGQNKQNTLTITGDGSLTISNKGGEEAADPDEYYNNGITVWDGELIIDGAEVTVDTFSDSYSAAVWSSSSYENGKSDIVITNGADVTAKSTATEDIMTHYGIYAGGGTVTVSGDSDLYASADGDASDLAALVAAGYDPDFIKWFMETYEYGSALWLNMLTPLLWNGIDDYDGEHYYNADGEPVMAQLGIGIYSGGSFDEEYAKENPCGIFIDDSNVRAIGSFAAMLVEGLNGTIKINDSTIVSPDDVNVRELMAVIGDDPDAAAAVIGAILAKGEGPVDIDAIIEEMGKIYEEDGEEGLEAYLTDLFDSIAKDVNIVRDAELQAQKAGLGIGDGIPTTGDNFHAEGLLIAMIAAGAVIAYCIRRKVSA